MMFLKPSTDSMMKSELSPLKKVETSKVPPLKLPNTLILPAQRATLTNFAQNYVQQQHSIPQRRGTSHNNHRVIIQTTKHYPDPHGIKMQSELMMKKTAGLTNESANPVLRMYQEKHKKEQVLISINCSKASATEKPLDKSIFGGAD